MLAELAIGGSSILAGGGGVMLWHQIRNSFGKVPHTEPPPEPTLAEVMQRGNRVVAQMARDVHKLYHPPGEDGKPCACAYCEIRADDEPEPEPEPPKPVEKKLAKWDPGNSPRGDYDDCATHRKKGCVCKQEGMAPCLPPQSVYQAEREKWETQVKNLEAQLKQLSEAYSTLKMGQDKRVVTKTVERKSLLDQKIEQLSVMADREGEPCVLTVEHDGRTLQVMITPQREPDQTMVKFGGEVVREIWHDKPLKIEIGTGRK